MSDVGDKELVRQLVAKFMAELPIKVQDMQKKILVAEYSQIKEIAHKLVSISGTYGFNQLSKILRSVEQGAVKSEEQTVAGGLIHVMQQWREIQEQLAAMQVDCEVHDGK